MVKKKIHIDKFNLNNARETAKVKAQEKKTIIETAKVEHIRLLGNSDINEKEFAKDFVSYTTKAIVKKHPDAKKLNFSDEKIASLYDYDLSLLKQLTERCNNIDKEMKNVKGFQDDYTIDVEPYTLYTQTEHQNRKLEAIEGLIEACEKVQKEVFPHSRLYQVIGANLPNLVDYDHEEGKVIPFYGAILKE